MSEADSGLQTNRRKLEIAALGEAGASQFDPLQFHYLEVLAQRTADQPDNVRDILDFKLAQAINALRARFEQARTDARDSGNDSGAFSRSLCAASHGASQGPSPRPLPGPLGTLARYAAQRASTDAADRLSLQYFRNTWSRISTGKQVTQALDQAPKNAGPINSHMLVLRSLALMRDVSPDYLNRFVSYVDTLLYLDQREKHRQAMGPLVAGGDTGKKTRARGGQLRGQSLRLKSG